MAARIASLVLGLVGVAAGLAQAQTPEFTSTTYPSASGARGAVAVDLNRDGWLDLATANTGRNTVAVLLNRKEGNGFAPAREISVGMGPFDIVAGDVNRDGIPDLVVTTPDAHAIEVLVMGADGGVASRRVIASGSESRGAALADVTLDGILDLIYSDYARQRVVILPGNETGGFGVPLADLAVSARPQGVAAGDFNHDGQIDIAVASSGANVLEVFYGNPSRQFTRRSLSAGRTLNVLTIADLNADGWDEIVAAATSSNVAVIFKGSPSGFTLAGTRDVGASPRGITQGDFNQDGRLDLAVGNFGSGSVSVLLGRGDGSVLPDEGGDFLSGAGARAVVAGDFDNDGRLDVAVGAQSAARVWVHANDTAFVHPGFSFQRGPTGFGPGAVGDFNENGTPDLLFDRDILLDGTARVRLDMDPRAVVVDVGVADYNRDGHQDALVATAIYDAEGRLVTASLDLFHGDGHGHFIFAKIVEGMPSGLMGFRTGDLDRDGFLDVVAFSDRDLFITRGFGAGPFVETAVPLGPGVQGLRLADVTGDGVLDAVIARGYPDGFSVLPGNGHGGFGAPVVAVPASGGGNFALGDMNHDGRLDVVQDGGSAVTVILAADNGGWAAPVEYPSTIPFDTTSGTILGDFNNDGHLDVLSWGGTMLLGDGDGTLGPPAAFAIFTPGGVAFDWNRDGLLDIVGGGGVILNERRAVNRPPVAILGPDRTLPYHQQFQLDSWCFGDQSFDPDLHRLSYVWRDETGVLSCNPEGPPPPSKAPGTYTFTLTVDDGRGGRSTDSMRVTIAHAPEIVLHAGSASSISSGWFAVDDETAASERRLLSPDAGAPKTSAPAANPSSYVDVYFAPDPTQTYKLWVRLKAENNYWGNDSIWLQFTGAVGASGQPAYAIGTTSGLPVNLEECSGCGISGWGWEDDGWGAPNRNGVTLRFPERGLQRIRIQVREDGVSIDQIVLSAVKYRTARPGPAKNDKTILPATQ